MTNKPMLSVERDAFEAFWRATMNVEVMDLHRCEFPMKAYDDQPYACHETDRSWMTWKGRALLDKSAPLLRCSFCDVTDNAGNPWSGHHESVDGKLIYRVTGCKDHKHLVDALDGSKPTPVAVMRDALEQSQTDLQEGRTVSVEQLRDNLAAKFIGKKP